MKHALLTAGLLAAALSSYAQVGIGTSSPQAFFHVAPGKTVLFGADTTTTGSKLIWNPSKAALRVGIFSPWGTIGLNSFSAGNSTTASGNNSTALGVLTNASGANSFAVGKDAFAVGETAMSLGSGSLAQGLAAVALGYNTKALGNQSFAAGLNSEASGYASIALGADVKATNNMAASIGFGTQATGLYSTALGQVTVASGQGSFAAGSFTQATGLAASALGNTSTASGESSFATGEHTQATGRYSTALGYYTTASGEYSLTLGMLASASANFGIAIGTNAIAGSERSIALGTLVRTGTTNPGSMIIGDASFAGFLDATAPNQFTTRFAGGYRMFTNATASIGLEILPNGNAWQTISDSTRKENFRAADGASFLKKISQMRLGSWNYKGQDAKQYRHYGPMAQDFYAAFGKDEVGTIGEDKSINQADFDGVNLIAIKALIEEVNQLKAENAKLRATNENLQKETASLQSDMDWVKKQLRGYAKQ